MYSDHPFDRLLLDWSRVFITRLFSQLQLKSLVLTAVSLSLFAESVFADLCFV